MRCQEDKCPPLPGPVLERSGQPGKRETAGSEVGALPRADSAASLLHKLEKAKSSGSAGPGAGAEAAGRVVQVKDKPAAESGHEGLMLLQRGSRGCCCKASSGLCQRLCSHGAGFLHFLQRKLLNSLYLMFKWTTGT